MFIETITYAADKVKKTWAYLETVMPASYNELNDMVMKLVENNNLLGTIYAKLNSPVFTGTPTAPTPAVNDSSTKLATTAWMQANRTTLKDHTAQTTNPLKNITVFDDIPDFVASEETNPTPVTDLALVGCVVLVEAYHSGNSWYRKYSDGWIEQGGVQTTTGTVNFLIPFSDANYTLVYGNSAGDGQSRTAKAPIKTGFTVSLGTNQGYQGWYACGY